MQQGLVSVLTPAYNTAGYIKRLLDSVLFQTYSQIEMIVIDDGSTDRTSDVVKSYIQPFIDRGFTLQYFYQENSGQSVAIKNGLQKITGQYLVWPDSDDFYASPDTIKRMVEKLGNAPENYKMVRTQERIVEDVTMSPLSIRGLKAKEFEEHELFYDCLYDRNGYYFCSGAYMVDVSALYETTKFDIYTDKDAGQNWQLTLPVLYKYRCMTIMEPLYNVVLRKNSHSRGQYKGYEAIELKYRSYFSTQKETLYKIESMPAGEKEKHIHCLSLIYNHKLFRRAVSLKRKDKVVEQYSLIRKLGKCTFLEMVLYVLIVHLKMENIGRFVLRCDSKISYFVVGHK